MSTCRDCGKKWGGRACHCTACHETFSTEANFGQHQGAIAGCVDPRTDTRRDGELRFKMAERGVWVENVPHPIQRGSIYPSPLIPEQ